MIDKTQNTKTKKQLNLLTIVEPTISTWFNRIPAKLETNNLPSLTQPDMALSMRQILDRFSRGQSIPRKSDAYYSDEDTSEFDRMDKFEKMEAAHNIREDIQKMQADLQAQNEKQAQPEPEKEAQEQPPKKDDKNSEATK